MVAHAVISRTIRATPDDLFDVVHDYHRRLEWDTLLRAARTVDDAEPAVGVEAVCTARRALGGFSFTTTYVTFRRPDLAAVRLTRPVAVFESWSASIRHKPTAAGTNVVYTMTFRCRPSWLAWLLEPAARAAFRLETSRRLAALDSYVTRRAGTPTKESA
ncbi:conserved hypothetical protein [Beutenbergia cavernae DSM 12333]|uniref:Polyketide cyclase/dehydrase n=1 Tax=Beutenbergia cavernae (strain ATCC BAA-8 / DSM 12333 / CCUG 43141 / JCM 11478 / NBRC 16432 / NCIMB 13614 / HKI 0122) TaxID=471853 RepID=C5C5Q5_BEUC1|nr:SRPBCC family protein [Beutenbergia cavernae]ACQ80246.1 conserved hypothetical protein [Beutenbergia cavernae DSM 12333]